MFLDAHSCCLIMAHGAHLYCYHCRKDDPELMAMESNPFVHRHATRSVQALASMEGSKGRKNKKEAPEKMHGISLPQRGGSTQAHQHPDVQHIDAGSRSTASKQATKKRTSCSFDASVDRYVQHLDCRQCLLMGPYPIEEVVKPELYLI